MQLPLQITIRDFPHSGALERHIRDKADKLSIYYHHIMACRVVVEVPQKHQHQGKLFNVRIDLTVPGEEVPITKNVNEDVYVALRDAFNDAKRQLKAFAAKQQGDGRISHMKIPLQGTVVRIFAEEGYGFIEDPDGGEVYFHHSIVKPSFNHLKVGTHVHFLEEMGEKGPQASRVRWHNHEEEVIH